MAHAKDGVRMVLGWCLVVLHRMAVMRDLSDASACAAKRVRLWGWPRTVALALNTLVYDYVQFVSLALDDLHRHV